MPLKPNFKKKEIVASAMKVVSEKEIESLTVQGLRNILKCSESLIFTVFNIMRKFKIYKNGIIIKRR